MKLERYYNELKVINFIQRIEAAGDNIYDNQELDQVIRKIVERSLKGSSRSLANAIPLIVNREYRTLAAIRKSSWEQLGLTKPEITSEEKCQITGLTLDDFKKIAQYAMKKKHATSQDAAAPAQPADKWACSACTFVNEPALTECEMCETKKKVATKPSDDAAANSWQCKVCTFMNEQDDTSCEICSSAKGAESPSDAAQGEEEKKDEGDAEEKAEEPK